MAKAVNSTTTPTVSRAHIERLIEKATALLDHLDGDPDLEDDGCFEDTGDEHEPWLGSEDRNVHQGGWSRSATHDREADDADDEDGGDDELTGDAEPWLCSLEEQVNQEHWSATDHNQVNLHVDIEQVGPLAPSPKLLAIIERQRASHRQYRKRPQVRYVAS